MDTLMADGYYWDGYLHWARDIEEKDPALTRWLVESDDDENALYEPIFVKFRLPFERHSLEKIAQFFRHDYQSQPTSDRPETLRERMSAVAFLADFVFDPIEAVIAFEHAIVAQSSPEMFLYRPVARTLEEHDAYDQFFEIIDVGSPAWINLQPEAFAPAILGDAASPDVFGAIIDNDIGFLNENFCTPSGETRFAAMWLQSRERTLARSHGATTIHLGQVLDADKINRLKTRYGREERRAYRDLNTAMHARLSHRRPPPINAHGSMVADLAFGNRSDDTRDVRLIGVQLPPEAARDTSGTMSESYIVQAVRWICFWARHLDATVPVVINISYGVMAGQKDGGKFIEAQIAREIDMASKYIDPTTGKGQKIEVVFAYGNSRNARQLADFSLAPDGAHRLTWEIVPDNSAPAFVELRGVSQAGLTDLPANVEIALIDPNGDRISITGTEGSQALDAEPPITVTGGTTAARLYNVPRRDLHGRPMNPGYTLAAVAPTRRHGHKLPTATPGGWILEVKNFNNAPVRIVVQVQRGDTAPGTRQSARQTRLEGVVVPIVVKGVAQTTVAPPHSDFGTNSAYANEPTFRTAGADRDVFGTIIPASYSGIGADWTSEIEPDTTHVVDLAFSFGVPVSGAYSGTRTRLSGTSAAAALRSRSLVAAL